MDLYTEKSNAMAGMVIRIAGVVGACIFLGLGTMFYVKGMGKESAVERFVIPLIFGVIAPVVEIVTTTLFGLAVVHLTRVTRDEIILMPSLAKWFPKLAWRLPIQSINRAFVADYAPVAERLEREGTGSEARISYFQEGDKKADKSFLNASLVDGEGTSLRVRRRTKTEQGVMLELSDGTSLFLGFNDPTAALEAIRQARGRAVAG